MTGIGRLARVKDSGIEIYEGQLTNGIPNGFGRTVFDNGSYHIGWYNDNKRCGFGKFIPDQLEKKFEY